MNIFCQFSRLLLLNHGWLNTYSMVIRSFGFDSSILLRRSYSRWSMEGRFLQNSDGRPSSICLKLPSSTQLGLNGCFRKIHWNKVTPREYMSAFYSSNYLNLGFYFYLINCKISGARLSWLRASHKSTYW